MSPAQQALNRTMLLENVFRPLVIGVMFGCIALSLVELVHLVFPTWNGTYLVLGCVLAAVEATYSHRLIRARSLRGSDLVRFRAIELGTFFVALKIGSYVGEPWAAVVADIRTWPREPYRVLDLETLVAFLLAVLAWHVATQTVRDYERLNEPPEFHRYYVSPMDSLTGRFFTGGVVLLIAAGLTRIGIAHLLDLRRPSVPGLVANVLVYFLLGLVMLGQVRLASLRKRWRVQDIQVADELPGRWVRYSLVFIGLLALVAFLLPTGYTMGLLEVAGWLLGLALAVLAFVATLLFWLITLPLALLLSLLGLGLPPDLPSQPPPQPPPYAPTAAPAPGWLQFLRSLVFWSIAVGMIYYVLRSYVRDHPELGETLVALRPIRVLRRWWLAIGRWLAGWGKAVGELVPQDWRLRWLRRPPPAREPFHFLRLGGLSPRAQVLYFYLSLVKRAGQQGIPRHGSQTPYEYSTVLESKLIQAQQELELLTQAFVEARYSPHEIGTEQARHGRANWQRVKVALRAIRPGTGPK